MNFCNLTASEKMYLHEIALYTG